MYVFWCVWSACACFDKAVVKSSTFAGSVETRQRWPTPLTLPELYKVTVGRPIAHCFSVKLKWKLDPPFLLWNNKKRKRCCVSEALMKITHVLSAGKTQGGTLLRSIVYLTLSLRQSWAHGCLSNSSLWRVQCHSELSAQYCHVSVLHFPRRVGGGPFFARGICCWTLTDSRKSLQLSLSPRDISCTHCIIHFMKPSRPSVFKLWKKSWVFSQQRAKRSCCLTNIESFHSELILWNDIQGNSSFLLAEFDRSIGMFINKNNNSLWNGQLYHILLHYLSIPHPKHIRFCNRLSLPTPQVRQLGQWAKTFKL